MLCSLPLCRRLYQQVACLSLVSRLLRSPTPKPSRMIVNAPNTVYPPWFSSLDRQTLSHSATHRRPRAVRQSQARRMLARSIDALTALHAPNHTIDAQTHRHHHTAPDAYSLGRLFIG
ncbi:hypothetical protein BDP81DRAFT_174145 [Colletotrichum phormii]|uniref:Uncharacterized protein n=1 Tax=Colletotrichum phormii TaxID=359342 RepID=A0AAI9ZBP5_9PEZI|nr:uncharacterized protein BDP81DRAFT_174145 [Colletotrichum phormii]KAK1621582.1 hypothetical protein BDP81DRAFT_174145 [Colletotrichum phormii]